MKIETRIIDGETWTKVPPGYAVLPLWAFPDIFMRGGKVAISNCGKDGRGRKGRIGDQAARETWAAMARYALKEVESDTQPKRAYLAEARRAWLATQPKMSEPPETA